MASLEDLPDELLWRVLEAVVAVAAAAEEDDPLAALDDAARDLRACQAVSHRLHSVARDPKLLRRLRVPMRPGHLLASPTDAGWHTRTLWASAPYLHTLVLTSPSDPAWSRRRVDGLDRLPALPTLRALTVEVHDQDDLQWLLHVAECTPALTALCVRTTRTTQSPAISHQRRREPPDAHRSPWWRQLRRVALVGWYDDEQDDPTPRTTLIPLLLRWLCGRPPTRPIESVAITLHVRAASPPPPPARLVAHLASLLAGASASIPLHTCIVRMALLPTHPIDACTATGVAVSTAPIPMPWPGPPVTAGAAAPPPLLDWPHPLPLPVVLGTLPLHLLTVLSLDDPANGYISDLTDAGWWDRAVHLPYLQALSVQVAPASVRASTLGILCAALARLYVGSPALVAVRVHGIAHAHLPLLGLAPGSSSSSSTSSGGGDHRTRLRVLDVGHARPPVSLTLFRAAGAPSPPSWACAHASLWTLRAHLDGTALAQTVATTGTTLHTLAVTITTDDWDDAAMATLVAAAPQLRRLTLAGVHARGLRLTQAGMAHLGRLPRLAALALAALPAWTAVDVAPIARGCPDLTYLALAAVGTPGDADALAALPGSLQLAVSDGAWGRLGTVHIVQPDLHASLLVRLVAAVAGLPRLHTVTVHDGRAAVWDADLATWCGAQVHLRRVLVRDVAYRGALPPWTALACWAGPLPDRVLAYWDGVDSADAERSPWRWWAS